MRFDDEFIFNLMIELIVLMTELLLDDVIDAELDGGNFFVEFFQKVLRFVGLK
jgi:hypothetical protein